jgi:hypothetical protein
MGTPRRCAAAVAAMAAALLAGGCGDTAAPIATQRPTAAGSSEASPGGALAGFLAAARDQDNSQVPQWLATTTDATDLAELLRVYADFGSGGIFWDVDGVRVAAVDVSGAGRADVTLTGDIAWCIGKAVNDPAATCSVVTPVSAMPHTYVAVQVDGRWKADIDINASSGLDHNPEASPTASAPSPTPP